MFTPPLAALSVFKSDALISALWITGIVVAAYIAVLWIALVLWVYRDIQSRSVDGYVRGALTLLVAAFNIPGLLLYLALRPQEQLVESYNRQLEMEAFLHEMNREQQCPHCQRTVADNFIACPYCRVALQTPCVECGRALKASWVVCPYCNAEQREAPAAATSPQAPLPAPVAATPAAFAPVRNTNAPAANARATIRA